MYNIRDIILENELYWLKSINMEIIDENGGIKIESPKDKSTDFNFFIPIEHIDIARCNRISDCDKNYHEKQTRLISNNLICEKVFDINFVALGKGSDNMQRSKYRVIGVKYEQWEKGTRKVNDKTRFFKIEYEGNYIGKMSVIETDFLIGIYDFEIFEIYRHKCHASNFLKLYIEMVDKYVFIQTWSTNLYAIKTYLSAGFDIFENLYRYNIHSAELNGH